MTHQRKLRTPPIDDTKFFAPRVPVYPRSVHGPVRTFKWAVLAFCLTLYYAMPWLRWDRGIGKPGQAILLDLPNRRFYFFGVEFWPQDIYYLTGALIVGAVSLFLVTSLAGRIWCGYACPQTVWTDLFMWFERRIEGDRNARMKRDEGPVTFDKIWRKALKHLVWVGVAFWTGGAWIMYYVDAPTVEFWTGNASTAVYGFTFLFTVTTYLLAGWAREQVCTYMCPWPRFQAAMLDEQSLVVTYQGWRGEPRGHGKRDHAGAEKLGACIDCAACMHVCPTGIDIRNGIQLHCINCGLCIDACNEMMEKTGQPKWLITWDSLVRQKAKAEGRFERFRLLRPRTMIYVGALSVLLTVMGVALAIRPHVELSVLHDRAPLYVQVAQGGLRNAYTVKISNKTMRDTAFTLDITGLSGAVMEVAGGDKGTQLTLPVEADAIGTYRVLVYAQPEHLVNGAQEIGFVLRSQATGETAKHESMFMGPGAKH